MIVIARLKVIVSRLLTTPYQPRPALDDALACAQTQEGPQAKITVAVLDAAQARKFFGVPLARRGIQPVYLRIENRSPMDLRLQLLRIDPNYYTPLEAAAANHFSILRRLSAFGIVGLFSRRFCCWCR